MTHVYYNYTELGLKNCLMLTKNEEQLDKQRKMEIPPFLGILTISSSAHMYPSQDQEHQVRYLYQDHHTLVIEKHWGGKVGFICTCFL